MSGTENYRKQRLIYQSARTEARRMLRDKYPEEWRTLRWKAYDEGHTSSAATWRIAMKYLVEAHAYEYASNLTVINERMKKEAGYEPAPRGGHATGRHAKKAS